MTQFSDREDDWFTTTSACAVCGTQVRVSYELAGAAVLCPNCKLAKLPGKILARSVRSEPQQKLIRSEGRRACIHNADAFSNNGNSVANPYELNSEDWHLWIAGYLETLKSIGPTTAKD